MGGFVLDTKFELYTWSHCPFCQNAKRLLDRKGYKYVEHVIDDDDDKRQELIKSSGQSTVPYIYLDGVLIGGFDDLRFLEEQGKI